MQYPLVLLFLLSVCRLPMGVPAAARLPGTAGQAQIWERLLLFWHGTVLLELSPGQEWVSESIGKRDLFEIRAAAPAFGGYGEEGL